MTYPPWFIREVKEAYPHSPDIHGRAGTGDLLLGRILNDLSGDIDPQDVINSNSLEDLKTKARQFMLRRQLYAKWLSLTR